MTFVDAYRIYKHFQRRIDSGRIALHFHHVKKSDKRYGVGRAAVKRRRGKAEKGTQGEGGRTSGSEVDADNDSDSEGHPEPDELWSDTGDDAENSEVELDTETEAEVTVPTRKVEKRKERRRAKAAQEGEKRGPVKEGTSGGVKKTVQTSDGESEAVIVPSDNDAGSAKDNRPRNSTKATGKATGKANNPVKTSGRRPSTVFSSEDEESSSKDESSRSAHGQTTPKKAAVEAKVTGKTVKTGKTGKTSGKGPGGSKKEVTAHGRQEQDEEKAETPRDTTAKLKDRVGGPVPSGSKPSQPQRHLEAEEHPHADSPAASRSNTEKWAFLKGLSGLVNYGDMLTAVGRVRATVSNKTVCFVIDRADFITLAGKGTDSNSGGTHMGELELRRQIFARRFPLRARIHNLRRVAGK